MSEGLPAGAWSIVAASGRPAVERLLEPAASEGHGFVARTLADWDSGTLRFDEPGEMLWLAVASDVTVGMCGLSVDPYTNASRTARLRHLYVDPDHRNRGIATALVQMSCESAAAEFGRVRLRTDSSAAARFYLSRGFEAVDEADATHALELDRTWQHGEP